jgi:hypothetical protein
MNKQEKENKEKIKIYIENFYKDINALLKIKKLNIISNL